MVIYYIESLRKERLFFKKGNTLRELEANFFFSWLIWKKKFLLDTHSVLQNL